MTTALDAATIRELLAKITQGEWVLERDFICSGSCQRGVSIAQLDSDIAAGDDGPFIAAAPAIVRQLLTERDSLRAENERVVADRDELSTEIEACHDLLDKVDEEYVEGTTSLVPLATRLKEYIFPEGLITDDMVNGDD